MPLPTVYGLDPDETWEIDFAEAQARRMVEQLDQALAEQRASLEKERDEKKRESLSAAIAAAEASRAKLAGELAAYVPGEGPVFVVGPLPNGKRAELFGESRAIGKATDEKEVATRDVAWSEEVVRWTVRDHRNLVSGKSKKPIAFATEEVEFAGSKRKLVARKTLEAYGRFIADLAIVILRSQRLEETGKNG